VKLILQVFKTSSITTVTRTQEKDITFSIFIQYTDYTVLNLSKGPVTINNYLLFCDGPTTCFDPYRPSSGRLFTKEYICNT
jgi:hypothetical protein